MGWHLGDVMLAHWSATRRCWSAVALAGFVAGCAVHSPVEQRLTADAALETFDAAWRIVYETHFDTTFNGVDWLALRDELRPKAGAARDLGELRTVIRDMLQRLDQSHFALIPREVADALDPSDEEELGQVGDLGLDVRLIGEQVVVTRVDPGSPAAAAGVRPGWALLAVGDERVARLLAAAREDEDVGPASLLVWARVMRRLGGSTGTECRIEVLDHGDRSLRLRLTRHRYASEPVKFGNLPTFFTRFASRQLRSQDNDVTVGVIWFNFWMAPLARRLDEAVDEFRSLDGIVVDLRGNQGGLGAMVMGVAGHFLNERLSLGTFKTRTTELRYVANPRRVGVAGHRVKPFAGPVAVIVDGLTGSASELFAGGMQSIGRVRVFGENSAGAVLPAAMDRLPSGDVLYHAFADFSTAEGDRLEGRGVIPDEAVQLTREDLLAGRDAVLDAAMRWIAVQRGAATAR